MPLVKVEIIKGKNIEYKKSILNGIHSALVEAFKIPNDDINHRIYELEVENSELHPTKTDQYTLIELTVFKGRSFEAKKLLYSQIVNNLKNNPGIDGKDILIVLNEPPLENWGIQGGIPANEANIGFKVDV